MQIPGRQRNSANDTRKLLKKLIRIILGAGDENIHEKLNLNH
jgi:hypothetical protein